MTEAAPFSSPPPDDPLSGAGMYRMFEGYLLNRNQADDASTFSRITFRVQDAQVVAPQAGRARDVPVVKIAVADSIAFPALSEVVSSSVVDDAPSGCQQVWFVRQGKPEVWLDRLSLAGQRLTRQAFTIGGPHWARSIAGQAVLPWPEGKASLLLAGTSDEELRIGVFQYLDATRGVITDQWTLPGSKPGSVLGSWILRDDFRTWLFVTIRTATALSTVAVDVGSLFPTGQQLKPLPPAAVHLLPDVPVATASGVNGTLGKLLSASASQQLILVATDPAGTPFVVLQGFDAAGPAQLARADIDTKFAKPRSSEYRVTCADLDNNGQEELVVGYAADYGGVSAAGAFVLFRFDQAQRKLEATSKYVAAGPGSVPLASMDLRLGSGLLGDAATRGVFVLGAGGAKPVISGHVQIFAGVIPVDPVTLRFPPYKEVPATLPAVTQVAETGLMAPGILGSVADLFGMSVTLGKPVPTQLRERGQLLAILQAPPFDLKNYEDKPSLSFTQSDERVKGLSVNSSKDWALSDDAGVSLGLSGASLDFHWSNTYGHGFSKTEDASTSMGVATTRTPVQLDRLVTIAVDYTVWQYPIISPARSQKPGGTMLVIFPGSAIPVQSTPIAYDNQYGYRAPYEPGSLLTYMNIELDGWDETRQGELLLFTPLVSLEVTSDPEDTNTYDMTNANESTIGKYFSVATSAGTSSELLKQTSLFSYLPASFGLNLATAESYSNSGMQMTSLSRTESLSITVGGGRAADAAMHYTMMPYIYQHASLGATVVAFKVIHLGPGWREKFKSPWPMLMLPFRNVTEHNLVRVFSRSISFEEQPGGTVHIVVEAFNQGFTDAEEVTAELYPGQPKFDDTGRPIIPTDGRIGFDKCRIPGHGRRKLRVPWTPADKPSFVTAVVWGDNRPKKSAEIAWNVYPESAYALLNLPGVQDA